MRISAFITITIATLMVSDTQASELQRRQLGVVVPAGALDPFNNSGLATEFNTGTGHKGSNKRDIEVIGLPGSGISAGKMVTKSGFGTTGDSSSGFYNKRGGVKVHPDRRRNLPLDGLGVVTSGGSGNIGGGTSVFHVKRTGVKVHHGRKRYSPIVGDLLAGANPSGPDNSGRSGKRRLRRRSATINYGTPGPHPDGANDIGKDLFVIDRSDNSKSNNHKY